MQNDSSATSSARHWEEAKRLAFAGTPANSKHFTGWISNYHELYGKGSKPVKEVHNYAVRYALIGLPQVIAYTHPLLNQAAFSLHFAEPVKVLRISSSGEWHKIATAPRDSATAETAWVQQEDLIFISAGEFKVVSRNAVLAQRLASAVINSR